jgi:hypothetical protein
MILRTFLRASLKKEEILSGKGDKVCKINNGRWIAVKMNVFVPMAKGHGIINTKLKEI